MTESPSRGSDLGVQPHEATDPENPEKALQGTALRLPLGLPAGTELVLQSFVWE